MTHLEDSMFQVQDVDVVVSSSYYETIILKDQEDRKLVSRVHSLRHRSVVSISWRRSHSLWG